MFSAKSQIINIVGSVGFTITVTNTHSPGIRVGEAATDNTEVNGCGWVPIKLYLQQVAGWIWPESCRFPNSLLNVPPSPRILIYKTQL